MTDAPIAYTVHDGSGSPPEWRRKMIAEWMAEHGIRPADVSADHPITVLNTPYRDSADDPDGVWTIQVIAFAEYSRNADGAIEAHPVIGRPVAVQRTVPLQNPFPTDPTTDGEDRGEADREEAQQATEEVFCPAREEGVPDPRQGPRPRSAVAGEAARNEGAAEEGPRCGHQAVSEPEEDRRQEEIGGA